ncbi:hypothetical protein FOMPIDRAFT_1135237 [Fomitopsis schrenkii]|uniref:Uncharacterized protein n=1 Tax=Fomitopsis schrenkii TaxID=2126942 RepID=S8DMP2_FOMSC|nr:hypothetical protein FOMPIDRAFT_1135237 [Fomitopsis schrenkii]
MNLRRLREQHVHDLLQSGRADASFWKTYRVLVDPRPRRSRVTAAQLQVAFEPRMNPPRTIPDCWDPTRYRINRRLLDSIPDSTVEACPNGYFTRPWSLSEVEDAKAHILEHSMGSARGVDRVAYEEVLRVPNENLRSLFQA